MYGAWSNSSLGIVHPKVISYLLGMEYFEMERQFAQFL